MRSSTVSLKLMGNQFEFTAVNPSLEACQEGVAIGVEEVKRIEDRVDNLR